MDASRPFASRATPSAPSSLPSRGSPGSSNSNGLRATRSLRAARLPRVMLVMEQDTGYHGGVLRGVIAYAKSRPRWAFHLHSPASLDPMSVVPDVRPDGIVINVYRPQWAETIQRLGIAAVNVGCCNPAVTLPRVGVDDVQAGRMAARYLAERGFRRFAFYGHPRLGYCRERMEGFQLELGSMGLECLSLDAGESLHRLPRDRERRWVAELPKPVGVFAASDLFGFALSEACRQMQVVVPDDIAILAMDNNELICHLAYRPLSTIMNPAERIGYEAAAMLERLMSARGAARREEPTVLIEPPGIITRQSTDTLAVEDAVVAEAVRFIRQNASRPLGVKELLRQVPVSRRALERRFAQALGRTPLTEIRRAHVERAKDLLAQTDLRTDHVARQSGLRNAPNLTMIFSKVTGQTPSAYRRSLKPMPGPTKPPS